MPMVPDVNSQTKANPIQSTPRPPPSQAKTKHQTKPNPINQTKPPIDRSGAAAVTHPKYHPSIIQESRTAHHRSQSRLSSYPPTRGVNQLIEVDHPVRGPPCLPSHQSCSQLTPNCTSRKLNPLTVNKGPCSTQEADGTDTMVLPQHRTRRKKA